MQGKITVGADGSDVVLRVPNGRSGNFIGAAQYREIAEAAYCFAELRGGIVRLVSNNLEMGRVENGRWTGKVLP